MKFIFHAVFIFTFVMAACMGPKAVSTIESNSYNDKTNMTTFTKFPFGSMSIPGKWIKVSYNQVSGQHNFRNADSVLTAVAINNASSYPFYKANMPSNTFVKEMYDWDSKYLAEQLHGNRTILKQDTVNHFIIWQLTTDNDKFKTNIHYLFGCENGIVFTVYSPTRKWPDTQKIEFIQTVYKNKTVGTCCK